MIMTAEPTGVLAAFAAGLSLDAIPDDVKDSAKILILDALACALAGHQGEETGQLTAMAAALGQSSESSVFGGEPMTLAGATMLNGYLITAVTMCDVHRATLTHITPEVIPPAFAIAERDGVSGAQLLVAIAAGLEVTTRIGLGLDYPVFRKKGWHGPGVIGPFGSAAAVGSLRGFDTEEHLRDLLRLQRAFSRDDSTQLLQDRGGPDHRILVTLNENISIASGDLRRDDAADLFEMLILGSQ